MLDLDHFKELNDTRGHPAGDECLRQIGAYLGVMIRRTGDVVARYGGEEFAVMLIDTPAGGAAQVAERLREGIASMGPVTASFGVAAMVPAAETSPEALVEAADRALYAAKEAGRNRVMRTED
jgi:diguanylate cyclase (GGDEF)-like protein